MRLTTEKGKCRNFHKRISVKLTTENRIPSTFGFIKKAVREYF